MCSPHPPLFLYYIGFIGPWRGQSQERSVIEDSSRYHCTWELHARTLSLYLIKSRCCTTLTGKEIPGKKNPTEKAPHTHKVNDEPIGPSQYGTINFAVDPISCLRVTSSLVLSAGTQKDPPTPRFMIRKTGKIVCRRKI